MKERQLHVDLHAVWINLSLSLAFSLILVFFSSLVVSSRDEEETHLSWRSITRPADPRQRQLVTWRSTLSLSHSASLIVHVCLLLCICKQYSRLNFLPVSFCLFFSSLVSSREQIHAQVNSLILFTWMVTVVSCHWIEKHFYWIYATIQRNTTWEEKERRAMSASSISFDDCECTSEYPMSKCIHRERVQLQVSHAASNLSVWQLNFTLSRTDWLELTLLLPFSYWSSLILPAKCNGWPNQGHTYTKWLDEWAVRSVTRINSLS